MNCRVALIICAVLTTTSGRPLISEPVLGAVGIGSDIISGLRQAANMLGDFQSSLLQTGIDTFKTGVNMGVGFFSSILPGMSPFADMGGTLLNTTADTMNTLLQGKIKTIMAIQKAKLDVVDHGLKIVGNVAQLGSNIASTLREGPKPLSSLPGDSVVSNNASPPGMASTLSAADSGVNSVTSVLSGSNPTAPAVQ